MERIKTIQKGDSIDFSFNRGEGVSIEGFLCEMHVKEFANDASVITPRFITPTNGLWSGLLTSSETDTLTEGTLYWIIGKLTNGTTDEQAKPPVRFQIGVGWA